MKNRLLNSVKKSTKYWWLSLCIGIMSIILGILFIAAAGPALLTIAILFVIGFIVSGLFEITFAIANRNTLDGWGWSLASGIIDLIIGILLAIATPTLTIAVMIFFVGFYIMFRSIWGIGAAVEMKRAGFKDWGWLLALAILGIIFSFLVIIDPIIGGGFIVAFAAISFVIYGIYRIYYGIRLKSIRDDIDKIENE